MLQKFKCKNKNPDCEEEVVYIYSPIDATVKGTSVQSGGYEIIVYLTCKNDHTHPYKVEVS